MAILMVTLAKHDRGLVDRFMNDVAAGKEVRALFLISGRYDVVAHVVVSDVVVSDVVVSDVVVSDVVVSDVVVSDVAHLRDLALDACTSREGVEQIESAVVFDTRASRVLAPVPTIA
ncbi:MAG: Lrp/AsnC ligand binding domain-containing protein [Salinarimonas sp.]